MKRDPSKLSAIQLLLEAEPDFYDTLTPDERIVFPYIYDLWLRPEQRIPEHAWRYFGLICGRGFGKTLGIACEINRRVEVGEVRSPAFMAPNEDRVDEVQVSMLIDVAPPWFKPEKYNGSIRWPNGVTAEVFTPIAEGRPRGGNFDLVWLTELVDWKHTTRLQAFDNITTACREGLKPQVFWDTTSKGRNDVIQHLLDLNAANPEDYPIRRGTTFDNPMLTRVYIAAECRKYSGVRFAEEMLGAVHKEAAGASYKQEWITRTRRRAVPAVWGQKLVCIDPGLALHDQADPTGFAVGGTDLTGDVYLERDRSDRVPAEVWGDWVVEEYERGAAGAYIETNHIGNTGHAVIKSRAALKGLDVRRLTPEEERKPFPARVPGVILIHEVHNRESKGARASGPASETEAGNVHLCGNFDELEGELTTYEPGSGQRSPNRYDAFNMLVSRLRNLDIASPEDKRKETAAAAAVAEKLNATLAKAAASRPVGL